MTSPEYVPRWAREEAKRHDLKALTESEFAQRLLKVAPLGSAVDIELCTVFSRNIMESSPHRRKLEKAMQGLGLPAGGVLDPSA